MEEQYKKVFEKYSIFFIAWGNSYVSETRDAWRKCETRYNKIM